MTSIIHPTLFTLLLTLAALGAPLACSAGSYAFAGSRAVSTTSSTYIGVAVLKRSTQAATSHVASTDLIDGHRHASPMVTWIGRAPTMCLCAAPPPCSAVC
ncbi:MAG: hypothetical protein EXS15_05345 [Phycisphaerales bacterium]|nr:hypothetical protein [Phycisphaerales bacterium]